MYACRIAYAGRFLKHENFAINFSLAKYNHECVNSLSILWFSGSFREIKIVKIALFILLQNFHASKFPHVQYLRETSTTHVGYLCDTDGHRHTC